MTWSRFRRASEAVRYPATAYVLALVIFVAVLAGGPSLAHATLTNGENAVDDLGEFSSPSTDTTDDWVKDCPNNGASSIGFNNPQGSAIDATNHWLFVVDNNNNRVLVFPLTSGNVLSSKTPSYVLGQPDFVTCVDTYPATPSGMDNPNDVAVDPVNERLFVADTSLNRVEVFSYASGFSNGMNATYVLGQTSMTTDGCKARKIRYSGPMPWPMIPQIPACLWPKKATAA